MKKLITLLAAGILAGCMATAAYAQAAGPNGGGVQSGANQTPGQKGKAHSPIGQKMLKQLNLTPDQKKQIMDLVQKFQQKHQQDQTAGAKPDRKAMAADRKQFLEDLGKILTPEQREKLKTLMEEARNKKGSGKGQNTGATGTGTAGSGGSGTGTATGGGNKNGGGL